MSNPAITDIDALMNASMDDIEDLPPVGVPPTGHYNLSISAERVKPEEAGKNEYIRFSYVVEAVNEVKNPEEEGQAAVGMKFSQIFSPFKKDGSVNDFGIGFLKEAVAPFSAHFGTSSMGETIAQIDKVSVGASLTRRADKKDADRFNFTLKDVVIL
jgi:hypothetical protein